MRAPFISTPMWWVIAAASVVVFLAFSVTLMPNRRYKIQVSSSPVAGAAFAVLDGLVKRTDVHTLLVMYSSVMLVLPLALLGHRREMREKVQDIAVHGDRRENRMSRVMVVQLVASLAVAGGLAAWFATAKP
ncbi:hypothetical protein ACFU99_18315 [Streptomyces sp. NPDC057654]|uniref:hypothetical protein n=1 Tax=Streptomyces sp. NPDC057654 TaxID=3346196 RepID=UPI003691CB13